MKSIAFVRLFLTRNFFLAAEHANADDEFRRVPTPEAIERGSSYAVPATSGSLSGLRQLFLDPVVYDQASQATFLDIEMFLAKRRRRGCEVVKRLNATAWRSPSFAGSSPGNCWWTRTTALTPGKSRREDPCAVLPYRQTTCVPPFQFTVEQISAVIAWWFRARWEEYRRSEIFKRNQ